MGSRERGSHVAQAEAIVEGARKAGLYVILGIGGGPSGNGHPGNGWFDIDRVRSFWSFYAPRYKDDTHVLYQIQNRPESGCNTPWQPETIAMERQAYQMVRSLAPQTHIGLFSFPGVPTPSLTTQSIDLVGDVVDWSNASLAMGGNPSCVTTAEYAQTFAAVTRARVSVIMTDLTLDGWGGSAGALEKSRVGWTSMRWLSREPELTTFRADHESAGISWCPDFGLWPQDSRTCIP